MTISKKVLVNLSVLLGSWPAFASPEVYDKLQAGFQGSKLVPELGAASEYELHAGTCFSEGGKKKTPSVLVMNKHGAGVSFKVTELPDHVVSLAATLDSVPDLWELEDKYGHWTAVPVAQIKGGEAKGHFAFCYKPNHGRGSEGCQKQYFLKQIGMQFNKVKKTMWLAGYGWSPEEISEYCAFFAVPAVSFNPSFGD